MKFGKNSPTKKGSFFGTIATKDSKTIQTKKMKPEDIEKQDLKDFYNKIKIINSISENVNVEQKGEINNQSDKPLKSKTELGGYVELVNEYKSLIKKLYDRRVKSNDNSELKNSIFKNRVIVDDFKGSSFMDNITNSSFTLNDLLEIKYWLSRVKKISGGWFSVWDDNAKNCCKKLTELLEKYLSNLNKNKISKTKSLQLKKPKNLFSIDNISAIKSSNTMNIKSKFQNEMPVYISKLQGYLSQLSNSLETEDKKVGTESSLQSSSTGISNKISGNVSNESIAIFDIARGFSNYFLNLLKDKEIALHEADLWKTIRHNKSKLEILKKDNSNNILNLLIWQSAADEILTQLGASDAVEVDLELLTKIENLVKQQRKIESEKKNPGSNPVKNEEKSRRLFIKCSLSAEESFSKLSKVETYNERSEWLRGSSLSLFSNFVEALIHLNSFIRCAYFNRIGKKSNLYEQLKNNMESLSISPVTSAMKKVDDILSSKKNAQNFLSSTKEWLSNLLNIKPYINSSWDGKVYSHIKSLNEIRETVKKLVSNLRNVSMDSNENEEDDNSNNPYRPSISELGMSSKLGESYFPKNSNIRIKNSSKISNLESKNLNQIDYNFNEKKLFSFEDKNDKELNFKLDRVNQGPMCSKKNSSQNFIDFFRKSNVDLSYSGDEN